MKSTSYCWKIVNGPKVLRQFFVCFSFTAATASKILEGEMFKITLSKPKNGNAQHLRVVQVFPLRTGFQPAIETLKEFYGVKSGS